MNVPVRDPWLLDSGVAYLNHGSFGATPAVVLRHQQELQLRLEREPVLFMVRELEGLLEDARQSLAGFSASMPPMMEDLSREGK